MKKLLAFVLPLSLLAACTSSVPSPVIEVTGLYLNDDETDYAQRMGEIPLLKVDDEMDIQLRLDGNGEELNTFLVDTSEVNKEKVTIAFDEIPEETLSKDKEFTDKENGKLGFKDGVSQTVVGVKAKVCKVTPEGVTFRFYLFSKPAESEGAKYELKVGTTDRTEEN
ncbi:DUF5035 family protein [Bacteroides sp.]